nr:MAG TPA: hypothetical protein [Caudoviricetes sp.]
MQHGLCTVNNTSKKEYIKRNIKNIYTCFITRLILLLLIDYLVEAFYCLFTGYRH